MNISRQPNNSSHSAFPGRVVTSTSERKIIFDFILSRIVILLVLFLVGVFVLQEHGVPAIRWSYEYSYHGNTRVIHSAEFLTPLGFRRAVIFRHRFFVWFPPDEELWRKFCFWHDGEG